MLRIQTAAAVLGCRTHAELVARHALALQALYARQVVTSAQPDVDPTPQAVRVDHGRWLFDCSCGAGVVADPAWPDARCLGCGSVFPAIVWPAEREAIEAALMARPLVHTRHWRPGETVADLHVEQLRHDLGAP